MCVGRTRDDRWNYRYWPVRRIGHRTHKNVTREQRHLNRLVTVTPAAPLTSYGNVRLLVLRLHLLADPTFETCAGLQSVPVTVLQQWNLWLPIASQRRLYAGHSSAI